MIGTILGSRYELLEIIGEGGMAKVYKARCKILDRIVAVKILKDEFSKDKSFVVRFKTEALSAARINHPNIVNIYDVGQENDIHYIVMEYVDGETLKEIIKSEAPLPVDKAVDIAIMICDGIHHAHEKGIIHRDIKPHNILVTEHGMVKVADFGIARAASNATITYGNNNIIGSVHYISPEQAKGEPVGRTTDIYSLGCVLYEMLTGKVPFEASSAITVALKHINDEAPSPRAANAKIPAALEGIIYKAIQKNPAHRFATAKDMRNALIGLHTNLQGDHKTINRRNENMVYDPKTGERDDQGLKKKRKMRPLGIALIAVAVLGLLSGVLSVMSGGLFGKEVAVPDLISMDYKQADEKLQNSNLVLNVTGFDYSDEFDKDQIISQDPGKGMKVKEGRQINVRVSKGSKLVTVPNVTGIDIEDASKRLGDAGLNMGDRDDEYDEEKPEGIVIRQSPSKGASVKSGTDVNLVVSKGKKPASVAVPDLTGLTVEKARLKLQDLKLVLGLEKHESSTLFYENQIASQDKSVGEMVDEGTAINVVISSGPGPQSKTRTLQFKLPSDPALQRVTVQVDDAGESREVYNQMHKASDVVYVGVNYYGTGTAEVFINGVSKKVYNLQ